MSLLAAVALLVTTADGRASLYIHGTADREIRTTAAITRHGDAVTVTAPPGKGVTDIAVPHGSRLDVRAGSGRAVIENVAAVKITKPSGELEIRGVAGDVSLEMKSGNATVRDVGGRLDAVTGTANLDASAVAGNATVTSINGNTTLRCVGGSVVVSDTNGAIDVRATRGDVSIDTTSGRAAWSGVPVPSRHYLLKTLSGVVTADGRGPLRDVAVALSTHVGRVSSSIALPNRRADEHGRTRRLGGVFGRGGAEIALDAFDGNVELRWNERGGADENCP